MEDFCLMWRDTSDGIGVGGFLGVASPKNVFFKEVNDALSEKEERECAMEGDPGLDWRDPGLHSSENLRGLCGLEVSMDRVGKRDIDLDSPCMHTGSQVVDEVEGLETLTLTLTLINPNLNRTKGRRAPIGATDHAGALPSP